VVTPCVTVPAGIISADFTITAPRERAALRPHSGHVWHNRRHAGGALEIDPGPPGTPTFWRWREPADGVIGGDQCVAPSDWSRRHRRAVVW
jgi:hypothetical protein